MDLTDNGEAEEMAAAAEADAAEMKESNESHLILGGKSLKHAPSKHAAHKHLKIEALEYDDDEEEAALEEALAALKMKKKKTKTMMAMSADADVAEPESPCLGGTGAGSSRIALFEGDGKQEAGAFLLDVEMQVFLNGKLKTDLQKIVFLCSHLRGAAQDWLKRRLPKGGFSKIDDMYEDFCDYFLEAFVNPGESDKARKQLDELTWDASDDASSFYGKYIALLVKIGNNKMSQHDIVFNFTKKLPSGMQAFVNLEMHKGACGVPALTDAKLAAQHYENAVPSAKSHAASLFAAEEHAVEPTLALTLTSILAGMQAELAAMRVGTGPISTASKHRTFTRLTPAERERCWKEQRCFKCKKTGHQTKLCRSPPSNIFPQ